MSRASFQRIGAAVTGVLAVVLLVVAGLAFWAGSFVTSQVHDQLAAQNISFPEAGSESISDPEIEPYISKYAGQQVLTGAQAEAFANHYIAVHLESIGGGKTYSELSTESQAAPDDTELAAKVQTMFRGETLRGMLLTAYAFGTMGTVAYWASGITGVLGLLLLVLAVVVALRARQGEAVPAVAEATATGSDED